VKDCVSERLTVELVEDVPDIGGHSEAALMFENEQLAANWTPIAVRPRDPQLGGLLTWSPLPGARITISEAEQLVDQGVLLMAHRHTTDQVELVVRLRASPRS
jgi:hypothetical protein